MYNLGSVDCIGLNDMNYQIQLIYEMQKIISSKCKKVGPPPCMARNIGVELNLVHVHKMVLNDIKNFEF